MAVLEETRIADLLRPYLEPVPQEVLTRLSFYLDLLVRWNARTNLTAIREPGEMVRRHFGESLFAAQHLGPEIPANLLDLGSGAGFPGLPIALLHPKIAVTLAESQNKKATFLREVIRSLGVRNVEVWAERAETMPSERRYHTVALRAVDDRTQALAAAAARAERQLLLLSTDQPNPPDGFEATETLRLPESRAGVLFRMERL